MRFVVIAIAIVIARTAGASTDPKPPQGPAWVSGPDRAYNCTHYLGAAGGWKQPPQVAVGEVMNLMMPRDKVMTFKLAAKGSKVKFELERAPAGAKLAGATFTWKVAGTPGQVIDFAVVAVGADGGRTPWPLRVTIADDKLFTAWSAGMGSVWPDCDAWAAPGWEVLDLDGDGKDDVLYDTFTDSDGTRTTHVLLQRGKLKFTEVETCESCSVVPEIAHDNTRLLLLQTSCCCVKTLDVKAIAGDHTVNAGGATATSCGGSNDPISLVFDAKKRLTGIDVDDEIRKQHLVWRDGSFVEP